MKLPTSPKTAKNSTVKNSDIVPGLRHDSVQSPHTNGNGHTNGSKHQPDASPSPTSSRKNLEAKTTARKTVTIRRPFVSSTDSKSTSRPNQNGHSSGATVTGLQRPVKHLRTSLGDISSRKKQRLITPSSEERNARPANSASPLARPTGFGVGKTNGETAPPPRLPTLSKLDDQMPSLSSAAEPVTAKNKSKSITGLSTYDDYIHSPPLVLPRLGNADIPGLNIGTTVGHTVAAVSGYDADTSSRDTSRRGSIEKQGGAKFPDTTKTKPSSDANIPDNGSSHSYHPLKTTSRPSSSSKVATPVKTTPDAHKSGNSSSNQPLKLASRPMLSPKAATPAKTTLDQVQSEKIEKSGSAQSSSEWVTRVPPLEQLRRRVAEQRQNDSSALDAYIYGQSNSNAPPPGVAIQQPPKAPKVIPIEDAFAIHMDPRNRNRPHSEEWYREKEEEIAARGGRKANFGKAVQRLSEQRRNEPRDLESFKETLPDRVRNDDDWAAAAMFFRDYTLGRPTSVAQEPPPAEIVTPVRVKRKYVRKNQPVPPQPPLGGKKPPGTDDA